MDSSLHRNYIDEISAFYFIIIIFLHVTLPIFPSLVVKTKKKSTSFNATAEGNVDEKEKVKISPALASMHVFIKLLYEALLTSQIS